VKQGQISVGHPVDVASGAVSTSRVDGVVKGRIPITWVPSYNTGLLDRPVGNFGPGWLVPYTASLVEAEHAWIFRGPDGSEARFEAQDEHGRTRRQIINLGIFAEFRQVDEALLEVTTWSPEEGTSTKYFFRLLPPGQPMVPYAIGDNSGNFLDLFYDNRDRVSTVRQRREQRALCVLYSSSGLINEIELHLPSGRKRQVASYSYDQERLVAVQNAAGETIRYDYDDRGLLRKETQPSGFAISFEYDHKRRCVYTSGSGGMSERRLRFFDFGLTVVTNSHGKDWFYKWNAMGQVTSVTSPLGHRATTDYDEFGRKSCVQDANGAGWRISYDARGNVASLVNPLGSRIAFNWDVERRLTSCVGENGTRTTFEYSSTGKTIAIVDTLGRRDRFRYNEVGDLVRADLADGRAGEMVVDGHGNPSEIVFDGACRRYIYDDEGQLLEQTEQDGSVLKYSYDVLGRPSSTELPGGDVYQFAFGQDGRLLLERGPAGLVRRYRYTSCGNLAERTDSEGRRLKYVWGTEPGELLAIINAKEERFEYSYDQDGRISAERGFAGNIVTYERDPAGRIITKTLPDGRTTSFACDALGRVIGIEDADDRVTFSYDVAGHLVHAANRFCSINFTYDTIGRLLTEERDGTTVSSRYEGAHRVELNTSWGSRARYSHDRGSLRSVNCGARATMEFERVALGRIGGIRRSNGVDDTFEVNEPESSTIQSTFAGGVIRRNITRHFGAAGLLDRILDSDGGSTTYAYDTVGRLTEFEVDGVPSKLERFAYDPLNNIVRKDGKTITTLSYRDGSRLQSTASDTGEMAEFAFDENGCLTVEKSDERRVNTYSQSGALLSSENGRGQKVEYAYDPLGRRIRKSCGDLVVEYLWDGQVLAAEQHSDLSRKQSSIISYVFEPDGFTPLLRMVGDRPEFFHTDHLGTPTRITDLAGTEVWQASYDAFGMATIEQCDTEPNSIRFPGQYFDPETGYHYNVYRYYDPRAGRYLTADPLGLLGGANSYAYTPTPTMFSDPLGLNSGTDDGLVDGLRNQAIAARGPETQRNGVQNVGAAAHHDQTGAEGKGANSLSPREFQPRPNGFRDRDHVPPNGPLPKQSDFGTLLRPGSPPTFRADVLQTHAEGRALMRLIKNAGGSIAGGKITMYSTAAPCPLCHPVLQEIANRTKTTIIVHHPEGEPVEFHCQTCGGG
jgi:RHS repeat-associated protein